MLTQFVEWAETKFHSAALLLRELTKDGLGSSFSIIEHQAVLEVEHCEHAEVANVHRGPRHGAFGTLHSFLHGLLLEDGPMCSFLHFTKLWAWPEHVCTKRLLIATLFAQHQLWDFRDELRGG